MERSRFLLKREKADTIRLFLVFDFTFALLYSLQISPFLYFSIPLE